MIGLGFARLKFSFNPSWIVISVGLALILFKISRPLLFIAVISVCFLLGWWRGGVYMDRLAIYQTINKKPIVIEAVVADDGIYAEKSQLAFVVNSLKLVEPKRQNIPGSLYVEGFGANMAYRGDQVRISGKIYPTRGGKQGTIRFAQISVLKHRVTMLEQIRHKFIAGVYTALPEPLASFALGLLIGQRSTIPKNVAEVLTMVGLTHIVAVSGYNLTIIVQAVQKLWAKRSRYQTAVISLSLVLTFVLLVGNSPSIMRAALVSFLSIATWFYGRKVKPLLLILLVAALTAGYNPIYLWSDVGWYLSFLAFFGVLIIAPLLLARVSKREPKMLALILTETIAAQVMTIPIILYIFGRTSFLSILANALVVPFVPLAMLLSLFAGLAGMVVPLAAGFVALPARWLLTYMLDVASLFAKIPHIVIEKAITLTQMLVLYVVLGFCVLLLWLKNRAKHGIITDKKASI